VLAALSRLPPDKRAVARRALSAEITRLQHDRDVVRWRDDPALYAEERLKTALWSKQQEIMEALKVHRRVAVKSCNGAGKTYLAATAIVHHLDTHPQGTAFVVSTAPTFRQVRTGLWREVRGLHRRGKAVGRVNQVEWIADNGDIIGFGASPADGADSTLLGIHATWPLVVIEEASGVAKAIFDAAESNAVNVNARILVIGNPLDPTSEFARVCSSPLWHVITIPASATPNFTGEPAPPEFLTNAISPQWVEDQKVNWGEDNPEFIARVLAEFPVDASDQIVRVSDLAKCREVLEGEENLPMEEILKLRPHVLGVDIAQGKDDTVVRERAGRFALREWVAKTPNDGDSTALIVRAVLESGARHMVYDVGGPGANVATAVKATLAGEHQIRDFAATPILSGQGALDKTRYANARAEMWWSVGRLMSQERLWDLSRAENVSMTAAQLMDAHWHLNAQGRIVVELKDEIRKRTGRSPDNADALLLAFYSRGGGTARIGHARGSIPTGASLVRAR
jgi:hypothetical protein